MSQQTLIYVIIIALLIIFLIGTYIFRKPAGTPKTRAVMGILAEVNDNLKTMENRLANPQIRTKFKTGKWQSFRNNIGFLDEETADSLGKAFSLIEEFNSGSGYTQSVEILREPLTQSKKGLSDWMRNNYQAELQQNKRGGYFSNDRPG
jgi:hypothetical protein